VEFDVQRCVRGVCSRCVLARLVDDDDDDDDDGAMGDACVT